MKFLLITHDGTADSAIAALVTAFGPEATHKTVMGLTYVDVPSVTHSTSKRVYTRAYRSAIILKARLARLGKKQKLRGLSFAFRFDREGYLEESDMVCMTWMGSDKAWYSDFFDDFGFVSDDLCPIRERIEGLVDRKIDPLGEVGGAEICRLLAEHGLDDFLLSWERLRDQARGYVIQVLEDLDTPILNEKGDRPMWVRRYLDGREESSDEEEDVDDEEFVVDDDEE